MCGHSGGRLGKRADLMNVLSLLGVAQEEIGLSENRTFKDKKAKFLHWALETGVSSIRSPGKIHSSLVYFVLTLVNSLHKVFTSVRFIQCFPLVN